MTKVMLDTICDDDRITKSDLKDIILNGLDLGIDVAIKEFYVCNDYPIMKDYDLAYEQYKEEKRGL